MRWASSYTAGRMWNGMAALENSLEVPQDVKQLSYGPAIPHLGI
jgi:hypothetical protein